MTTKTLIEEAEKEIEKLKKIIRNDRLPISVMMTEEQVDLKVQVSKLQGFLLGKLEQLKNEKEFWEIERSRIGHIDDNSNSIQKRLSYIQKQIKQIEEKLK
jgi:capsule polysaccharide export protein KpsE/RkpR